MVKSPRLWLVAGLCALGLTTFALTPMDRVAEASPELIAEASDPTLALPAPSPESRESLDQGRGSDSERIFLAEGECPKTCSEPYGPACNDRWDCEEYCSDPGPQGGIPFCSTCGCCICA